MVPHPPAPRILPHLSPASAPPPPGFSAAASAALRDRAALSVKELRDALRARGVDYSSCIEKSELIALLRSTEHLTDAPEVD